MRSARSIALVLFLAVVLIGPGLAAAQDATPATDAPPAPPPPAQVLPPDQEAYGRTWGEWSAAWWQWVTAVPADRHPLLDDTGEHAAEYQSGPVWFLAGKFCIEACDAAIADRSLTVPAGTALFFPIANAEWDNLGNPPTNLTEENLRALVKQSVDGVTGMACEIDGVPVGGLESVFETPYRVTSPPFDYSIPEDNLYGALGLDFPALRVAGAVSDGVWLMLPPFEAGEHTIHFTASFPGGFNLDITYRVTVEAAEMATTEA